MENICASIESAAICGSYPLRMAVRCGSGACLAASLLASVTVSHIAIAAYWGRTRELSECDSARANIYQAIDNL